MSSTVTRSKTKKIIEIMKRRLCFFYFIYTFQSLSEILNSYFQYQHLNYFLNVYYFNDLECFICIPNPSWLSVYSKSTVDARLQNLRIIYVIFLCLISRISKPLNVTLVTQRTIRRGFWLNGSIRIHMCVLYVLKRIFSIIFQYYTGTVF